jgi:hypothetical protein
MKAPPTSSRCNEWWASERCPSDLPRTSGRRVSVRRGSGHTGSRGFRSPPDSLSPRQRGRPETLDRVALGIRWVAHNCREEAGPAEPSPQAKPLGITQGTANTGRMNGLALSTGCGNFRPVSLDIAPERFRASAERPLKEGFHGPAQMGSSETADRSVLALRVIESVCSPSLAGTGGLRDPGGVELDRA